MLRQAGADVDEADQHVRFPREMIVERISTAPAEFTLHSWNPEKNLHIGGTWMANGTVASAPHIVGLDGVRRTGDQVGFDDLLKLAQMLNSIHFVAGYPVEPVDIHASVRHIHAAFDVLTLTDKHIHCYSLGRQKNRDCIEMVRIARGVDDATLDREPSIFTVINSNSPLRLDTPMLHGIIEMASRNQPVVMTPVHPRRGDGAGHVGRGAGATERGGVGRHRAVPDRAARRTGGLRRLHLQRRHAVGGTGVRHSRVRAHGDGRRPIGPPLQPAVPQQQRVRSQCRRCPGSVRERLRAVGMRDGRRQHDDARRRLDGGWAARQPRQDGARCRPLAHGVVDDGPGRGRRRHAGHRRHRGGRPRRTLLRRRSHAGAISHGVLQADDQRLAELRELGRSRQTGGCRQGQRPGGCIPRRLRTARDGRRRAAKSSKPSSPVGSPTAASPPISNARVPGARDESISTSGRRRRRCRRRQRALPPHQGGLDRRGAAGAQAADRRVDVARRRWNAHAER